MTLDAVLQNWTPRTLALLRVMSGLMLLQFGMAKVLGFPALAYFAGLERFSLPWIAGLIELVLGPLLILGLFTRPVAFVLSGLMAFAYFLGHAPQHFIPLLNGGTMAVLFCFIFFYLAFAGGGAWSLDAGWRNRP